MIGDKVMLENKEIEKTSAGVSGEQPATVPPQVGDGSEVRERPTRRRLTAEYKRRILAEIDGSPRGRTGEVLRREGLYSSHLATWRRQFKQGLVPQKRGPKPRPDRTVREELEKLKRDHARLEKKLRHAEIIIDVQKKLCDLLGIESTKETL